MTGARDEDAVVAGSTAAPAADVGPSERPAVDAVETREADRELGWPRKVGTIRDDGTEMKALLDGLVPADGRVPPPRGPVKIGPQSDGRKFVAYAGEAPLAPGSPAAAEPHAPVLVRHSLIGKESLRELVVDSVAEDDERLRDAERERRGAEPTQLRPASGWRGAWFAAGGAAIVLLAVLAAWGLRGETTASTAARVAGAPSSPPSARGPASASPTLEASVTPPLVTAGAPSAISTPGAPVSPHSREPSVPAPSAVRVTSPRPMPPHPTSAAPDAPLPPSKDFTQAPL